MPLQSARLARLLGAPPHLATFEQVMGLVSRKAREDADLDFKGANSYIIGGEGADELAKDVTGMANARGGLIVIGIAEDDQACAKAPALAEISAKITEQMEQILRSRVVPWLSGAEIRPHVQPLPGGKVLIASARTPGTDTAEVWDGNGHLEHAGLIGDAIEHLLSTHSGAIWTGYFDEGLRNDARRPRPHPVHPKCGKAKS